MDGPEEDEGSSVVDSDFFREKLKMGRAPGAHSGAAPILALALRQLRHTPMRRNLQAAPGRDMIDIDNTVKGGYTTLVRAKWAKSHHCYCFDEICGLANKSVGFGAK